MENWMEGYNSDIEYTAKYYKELSPNYLNLSALLANVEPILTDQPFSYCELGCGQGMTVLSLAANYPHGTFYAVDYNPSHISRARRLAKKSNLNNVYFLEKSFQELVDDRDLLPEFDFMVFHGIYSWVSDENRTCLVHLCRSHVKSGGLVYNSYNAKPGWSHGEAMQKLIYGLSEEYPGSSLVRMEKTINILKKIKDIKSGYFVQSKTTIDALMKKITVSDKQYTIHEYLNDGWRAFFFPDVANEMKKAKLNYLSSAFPADAYTHSLLPGNIRGYIDGLHDENNRELLKDLTFNTAFRKDIYIRGSHNRINSHQQYAWLARKNWILLQDSKNKTLKIKISAGETTIDRVSYSAVVDNLNNGVLSTETLQKKTGISPKKLIQTLVMLFSSGQIGLYEKEEQSGARALNTIIAGNIFDENTSQVIALPNIHSAVMMDIISIGWLDGINRGLKRPEELVDHVYGNLSARDLSLTHENKKISGELLKKQLIKLESEWREEHLPIWIRLGIVDDVQ